MIGGVADADHDCVVRVASGPVSLPLQHDLHPRHAHPSCLCDAMDGGVVRHQAGPSTAVLHSVDLVPLVECL